MEPENPEHFDRMSYVVITPVRNEAKYIEKTLDSMCRQTAKPAQWVIVDDGSTDDTAEIVASYAAQHAWISLVSRQDRGGRQRGKGVIEAFYAGFDTLTPQDYDCVVKLDGDLSFEPTYFESLLREFAANPILGIAGGAVYERLDGERWVLQAIRSHVRGPTKVYRRTCFEAIGGLVPALGWDGVDEWQALTLGWQVQTFMKLRVKHYRVTGVATGSLKSRQEQGYGAYYMGYHPLYTLARGLRYMLMRPYFLGGMAFIWGCLVAWLRGDERLSDPAVVRYIRRSQLQKLRSTLSGKPVLEG